jgi:NAD(P)-dependent dehydrogenase (short-subunit alcohol dehydrogenase family)
MNKYQGRIAFVTGGAAGIGRALCGELAAAGATVVVADINEQGAAKVAESLRHGGGRADALRLDVSDGQAVARSLREAAARHGRLDYVFNNAGISIAGDARDVSEAQWRRIVDINLWGVLHGTRAAYEIMARQGSGHIVNIASLAGLLTFPANVPYSMTKHAVVGLSLSLRAEAADLGVKVSVVCPGYVKSDIFESSTMLNAPRDKVMAQIPFGLMDTAEAARTILERVARNPAVIVFPRYARLLWWLYRVSPALLAPLERKTIRDFRAVRTAPPLAEEESTT